MDWEYLANSMQQTSQAVTYGNMLSRYPFLQHQCNVRVIKTTHYGQGILIQLPNSAVIELYRVEGAYLNAINGTYIIMTYVHDWEIYLDTGYAACKYKIR